MIRRVLLALTISLPLLVFSLRPAAAQTSDPCAPNYARISRMQGLLHWEHFPLRIAFAPLPDNLPGKETQVQAALAGFNQWVEATHGQVSYTVVSEPKQADLLVSLTAGPTVPGQGCAVGYTSMVFCGTSLRSAEMQLATGGTTPGDLQTVAAHEFGHALGINGHSDNSSDIMYPTTLRLADVDGTPLESPEHPITVRDLNTLKVCYPGVFAPHLAARPDTAADQRHTGAALIGARHRPFRGACRDHVSGGWIIHGGSLPQCPVAVK